MGMSMPPELDWVFLIAAGEAWPRGDEDRLRRLGEVWQQHGENLTAIIGQVDPLSQGVLDNMSGTPHESFGEFITNLKRNLPEMATAAGRIGDMSRSTAVEVQYAKLMIIFQMALLAYEITTFIAEAPATFGASLALIPPAIAATRAIVRLIARRLLTAIVRETALQLGMDATIQSLQMLTGDRTRWNTGNTIAAGVSGAISGVTGGLFHGVGGVAFPRFTDSIGGHVVGGAINGALTTELTNLIFHSAGDVGWGAASEAFAGAFGRRGGRGGEGQHLDADIPHIDAPDLAGDGHLPGGDTPLPRGVSTTDAPPVQRGEGSTSSRDRPSQHPSTVRPAPVATQRNGPTTGPGELTNVEASSSTSNNGGQQGLLPPRPAAVSIDGPILTQQGGISSSGQTRLSVGQSSTPPVSNTAPVHESRTQQDGGAHAPVPQGSPIAQPPPQGWGAPLIVQGSSAQHGGSALVPQSPPAQPGVTAQSPTPQRGQDILPQSITRHSGARTPYSPVESGGPVPVRPVGGPSPGRLASTPATPAAPVAPVAPAMPVAPVMPAISAASERSAIPDEPAPHSTSVSEEPKQAVVAVGHPSADLVDTVYADGPRSRRHTSANAPQGRSNRPNQRQARRRLMVANLPAVKAAADRLSRTEDHQEARDERPVPVPARSGAEGSAPVKAWSLTEAADWFTKAMATYFAGMVGEPRVVPFLSGGAALNFQGGARSPKDLDFRITTGEARFTDFDQPGGRRFLKYLNEAALSRLTDDNRVRARSDRAPTGAVIVRFAPLGESGVGSTSMGSLNILGQEISLTIVPGDRPATTQLDGNGPGKDTHVLTLEELAADKLRTMISRTKTGQESVNKVAQDLFDVLDAIGMVHRPSGGHPPAVAAQVRSGLAARAAQYSETNILGTKLHHWSSEDLHELMTVHAVLTARAHLQHGERRQALASLLDNAANQAGEQGRGEWKRRMWNRLEKFAKIPVDGDMKAGLRPWLQQWNDPARFGPGRESRASGRPVVRWGAAPGDESGAGAETVFAAPEVVDLLGIHADDIVANVRDTLVAADLTRGNRPEPSADAEQIVRVLAFSDGFRPLLDKNKDAQTLEAFDLVRNRFDKAFKRLRQAGLVASSAEGLSLSEQGWQLVPTRGSSRVDGSEGRRDSLVTDSILDDETWRHSGDPTAPWFDARTDRVASDVVGQVARTRPITGRVRGEQGGLYSDSLITTGGMRLHTWRGPIAYDVREFDVEGDGRRPVPVQDHHVKLFLDQGDTTSEQAAELERRAKQGVDELYNQGNRLPNGRQFHVTVDFVPNEADAHGVVEIGAPGTEEHQLHWPVNLSGRKIAHEVGHFLGLPDEYFETGPVKPVLNDKPGRGRVRSDNGPMTAGVEAGDARLKPRNLWLVERRQKDIGFTACPSTPRGEFPAPPHAPPRIEYEPSQDFAADVNDVLDSVQASFSRSSGPSIRDQAPPTTQVTRIERNRRGPVGSGLIGEWLTPIGYDERRFPLPDGSWVRDFEIGLDLRPGRDVGPRDIADMRQRLMNVVRDQLNGRHPLPDGDRFNVTLNFNHPKPHGFVTVHGSSGTTLTQFSVHARDGDLTRQIRRYLGMLEENEDLNPPATVLARIPEYLLDNEGAGPSEQVSVVVGADFVGSMVEAVPALRDNSTLHQIQKEVSSRILTFVGENRGVPYRIVAGRTAYEVRLRAELLWDMVTVVDPDAEPGAMKSVGDNKTISDNRQSGVREGDVGARVMFTATPPLVVGGRIGIPATPNEAHETVGQRKTNQSTGAEVDGLRRVRVPVRVTYSILGADGLPVGQITDPSNPLTPARDRSVTGEVDLDVPLTLGRRNPNAAPVQVPRALPAAAIDELYVLTEPGRSFFEQTATTLPTNITEFRSPGRGDLQTFVSDANLRSEWHRMAVTEQEIRENSNVGWVRSGPLVAGPEILRLSNKAGMVEMRAVARRVEVIEMVPDMTSSATRFVKDTLTKSDGTTRGVNGTLTVVAGADVAGAVHVGVGPAFGVSVTRAHTVRHTEKTLAKTSVTQTDDGVRYRTEHELHVRSPGGEIQTLAGHIVTYQSTSYDKAAKAGMVPHRDEATPTIEGISDTTTQRHPPAHVLAGTSLGGTVIDHFRGGENLYRAVAGILRKLPGRKWYHLTRDDYLVEFGNVAVTPNSRGLTASVERLLGRGESLRRDLSDEHLSEMVDTMLTDRGLTFTVKPKNATFQDYVTTVTLRATLDEVRGAGSPVEVTFTSAAEEKLFSTVVDEKAVKAEIGVGSRVWHPFGTHGTSQTGSFTVTKSKVWSHSNERSAQSSEGTKRTHGDTVSEDGTVSAQRMWPFSGRLTITTEIRSYVRKSSLLRSLTLGRPGMSVPDLIDMSGEERLRPQEVELRVLVPEQLTTVDPPPPLQPVLPRNVRTMDFVPKPNELTRKAARVLDDVDVVAVFGTDHIGNAVDERVHAASGDLVDAPGPDGRALFPRGNSRSDEEQLTPDALRRSRRRFEPITIDRFWERRRRDLSVDAAVVLTPSNPVPVGSHEYQAIEKSHGSAGGISKVDSTASSFGVVAGDVVVPVSTPLGNDTMIRFRGILGGEVTPLERRWGQGRATDFGSSSETTVRSATLVRETLVWTDVRADVVVEAKYRGNIDRAEWFPGREPGRAGVSFELPRSMLMWATDEQIAAMRGAATKPDVATGSVSTQDGVDGGGVSVPSTPVSVVDGKGVSLGLGALITTVDVRDRMPHLHRRLAENLGEQGADALLPKSRHDAKHDNHGMVDRLLANVNRAASVALNGGQIVPLRRELSRWQGRTYYLNVSVRFVAPPTFSGIEHVDKLAVSESVSTAGRTSKSSGRTVGKVGAVARPGIGIAPKPDPATANRTTGHGQASGNLASGLSADATLSRRDDERTEGVSRRHTRSAETSGPMAAYAGRIALDIRIERDFGVGENSREVARQVVARDSAAHRDVTLLKLPEESFPPPSGSRAWLGEDDPEPWTSEHSRPTKLTPEYVARWRTEPGHVVVTEPGATRPDVPGYEYGRFIAEHYFGDMTTFRERATLAVARATASSNVDSRTVADLKAALTPTAVEAGLPGMIRGEFVVPLKDFDLEVHARLSDERWLSSASAAVNIEAKTDFRYMDESVSKAGRGADVMGLPLQGSGGVGHPDGKNSFVEGRDNFGSLVGGTQSGNATLGGHESVLEARPQSKSKVTTQTPSADPGKVTQVDLHDVDFLFVARPKEGSRITTGTGVSVLPVATALGIRHHPDATRPLPESLIKAVVRLAEAGKAWTAEEKASAAARVAGDAAAHAAAQRKRAGAEAEYWVAKREYDTQIAAARQAARAATPATDGSV